MSGHDVFTYAGPGGTPKRRWNLRLLLVLALWAVLFIGAVVAILSTAPDFGTGMERVAILIILLKVLDIDSKQGNGR